MYSVHHMVWVSEISYFLEWLLMDRVTSDVRNTCGPVEWFLIKDLLYICFCVHILKLNNKGNDL